MQSTTEKKPNPVREDYQVMMISLGLIIVSLLALAAMHDTLTIEPITGMITVELDSENISSEIALQSIFRAEEDMIELHESGLGVRWINDTLVEANRSYQGEEYAKVIEKTTAISEKKKEAYLLLDKLHIMQERATSAGVDIQPFILMANAEMKNERYDLALEYLDDADQAVDEELSKNTLMRTVVRQRTQSTMTYIKKYYIAFAGLVLVLFLALAILTNRFAVWYTGKKIDDQLLERGIVKDLIKKAQEDHYACNLITQNTYETKMSNYRQQLANLNSRIPVLESRLAKLHKFRNII